MPNVEHFIVTRVCKIHRATLTCKAQCRAMTPQQTQSKMEIWSTKSTDRLWTKGTWALNLGLGVNTYL